MSWEHFCRVGTEQTPGYQESAFPYARTHTHTLTDIPICTSLGTDFVSLEPGCTRLSALTRVPLPQELAIVAALEESHYSPVLLHNIKVQILAAVGDRDRSEGCVVQ